MSRSIASSISTSACGSRHRTRRQSRVNRTSANPPPFAPGSTITSPIFTNSSLTASGTYRSRKNSSCRRSAIPSFVNLRALSGSSLSSVSPQCPLWLTLAFDLSLLPPPRKRPPRRNPKRLNQFPHRPPPRNQRPRQLLQLFPLPAIPLRRNLSRNAPHHILFHLLDP